MITAIRVINKSHAQLRQLSSNSSPWVCQRLTTRTLIRLGGVGAANYLQGLITNDMKHLTDGATDCMYAMFLNAKGRVLYDSLIYKDSNDSFLIESDAEIAPELVKHLNLFKVRRKLSIEALGDSITVWHANKTTSPNVSSEGSPARLADAISDAMSKESMRVFKDPRCAALGYRLLSPQEDPRPTLSNSGIETVDNYYTALRYGLGIAEGITELPPGNCFALESNCDYMHGVSFHKGCYVGQEVTARTHHTGVVRKRIMPLLFEKEVTDVSNGASVTVDGKSVGKMRGAEKDRGVALLRIDDVLKAKSLLVDGNSCTTHRPGWWPTEAPKGRPA